MRTGEWARERAGGHRNGTRTSGSVSPPSLAFIHQPPATKLIEGQFKSWLHYAKASRAVAADTFAIAQRLVRERAE